MQLTDFIRFLYLIRVPILTWIALGGFGPFASSGPGRQLLYNLLDLGVTEAFWVSLFGYAAACAGVKAAETIGKEAGRFGLEPISGPGFKICIWLVAFVSATILCVHIWRASMEIHPTVSQTFLALALLGGLWIHMLLLLTPIALSKKIRPWGPRVMTAHYQHVRMGFQFLVYLGAYVIVSTVTWLNLFNNKIDLSHSGYPPTLAFLCTAATFLCLLFSCFTFYLDRYRIPLILPLAVIAGIAAHFGSGDHVFQVVARKNVEVRLVEEVLNPPDQKVILVAAAGGGIQAAGWTARVLGGLQKMDARFADSVRLISAVSGGAVGTLFYMRSYRGSGRSNEVWDAEKVFHAAAMSNLDPIAWGLLRYDIPPASWFRFDHQLRWATEKDRGWALETALARRAGLDDVTLSDWAERAGRGLPAVVFNATLSESGRPILFSTVDLPQDDTINFVMDRRQDVRVATAARLSAGFPFVSPPARPDSGDLVEHVVDGGYYDASGIASVMTALKSTCGYESCCKNFGHEAGCTEPDMNRILVLRIESFPNSAHEKYPPQRSWVYDIWAPLDALFNVRSSSQLIRGESELRIMTNNLQFEAITLRYDPPTGCSEPSLSWELNEREIDCLNTAWINLKQKDAVIRFLNRPLHQ